MRILKPRPNLASDDLGHVLLANSELRCDYRLLHTGIRKSANRQDVVCGELAHTVSLPAVGSFVLNLVRFVLGLRSPLEVGGVTAGPVSAKVTGRMAGRTFPVRDVADDAVSVCNAVFAPAKPNPSVSLEQVAGEGPTLSRSLYLNLSPEAIEKLIGYSHPTTVANA